MTYLTKCLVKVWLKRNFSKRLLFFFSRLKQNGLEEYKSLICSEKRICSASFPLLKPNHRWHISFPLQLKHMSQKKKKKKKKLPTRLVGLWHDWELCWTDPRLQSWEGFYLLLFDLVLILMPAIGFLDNILILLKSSKMSPSLKHENPLHKFYLHLADSF